MIHVVIPDAHTTPGENNDRAIWLGHLISDIKPDVVVDLGDTADMASLCTYDRGTKAFQGRSYRADVEVHNDYQDKLWSTVRKSKRKLPRKVRLIGNHEQRIVKAINIQPELEGTISLNDLDLERYYDDVVYYEGSTPGTINIDGITYAHYLTSGVMGRAISGEHMAYTLLTKKFQSCTVGHNHTFDYCIRTNANGNPIMGLCGGVFQSHRPAFAGLGGNLWRRGVCIKRFISAGCYDLEWVSLDRLKKEYK